MNKPIRASKKPFLLEEATIAELHAAIQAGERPASMSCSNTSSACAPTTGRPACWSRKTARRSRSHRHGARRRAAEVSDADRQSVDAAARSRPVQRPAARIRPHGADRVRSIRAAAVRHDRRHAECRAGQCAGHAEHSRRALRHLPRRLRPCIPPRAAAPGAPPVCEYFRQQPDALEHAAELDAAFGRNPIWKRCRCTAWCSHSRTRSIPRTCVPPAAATRATTSISRRVTISWSTSCARRARSSSPRRSTPNTTAAPAIRAAAQARQGPAFDARLPAQHLGRQSVEPL